ncbi:MAG: hypothetical protein ABJA50_01015 [Chloroflexota bacterium]
MAMDDAQTTEMDLGTIRGLKLTADNSALLGSLLLWVALGVAVVIFLRLSVIEAVTLGLVGAILHWIAELMHQLGHAQAARKAGYPMIGVRFWWLLSSSIYPADEPTLPAQIHIRRALGGPIRSFILAVVFGIVTLLLPPGTYQWWAVLFFTADNFLVFTVGSLLPLGFTDGTTLLRWLRK